MGAWNSDRLAICASVDGHALLDLQHFIGPKALLFAHDGEGVVESHESVERDTYVVLCDEGGGYEKPDGDMSGFLLVFWDVSPSATMHIWPSQTPDSRSAAAQERRPERQQRTAR